MFFDPVSQQYPNSVAHKLQTTCLQAALSDPCLFHATLFSTSAFLDFAQGMRDNPVTTYHKAETIRMVQDAISKSDSDGLPDSIITATTYLLCIAVAIPSHPFLFGHDDDGDDVVIVAAIVDNPFLLKNHFG